MEKNLIHTPEIEELQDVYSFLDNSKDCSWSVLEEYPLAFDINNHKNIRVVKESDTIKAHAVLKTTLVRSPYAVFNVGMIGSVFTDQKHRDKGFSSQLINSCIDQAQDLKCDFVILWTDMFDFYRKFGFELAGSEISLIINKDLKPNKPRTDLKFINTSRVDPQAILRLYNLHSITTHRSVNDIKKYLQIPNSRVYTAWNDKNQIEAFAVEGKGNDLQGYVHEWAGNTSALLPLFKFIHEEQKKDIVVITPKHCKNLIRNAQLSQAKTYEGILGMIKILDLKSITKKIQRIARNKGIKDFAIDVHDDKLYFGNSQEMFKTESQKDIAHLLFGPQSPKKMHKFPKELEATLEKILPLPMWIWGWDSI